ncbi:MAG: AMP-binding protein [Dehalococcoidia bacterium]|nr:AMP-binding protein [Dehalococcoidia bacterium]
MNIKLMLEEAVNQYSGKSAIVFGDRRISYAEVDESSNKIANALIKIGIGKGDRVATLLTSSPEFVIVFFGIIKTGAIAVPMDTEYKFSELQSLFGNCQPKVLVAESAILEPLIPVLSRFNSIEHVIVQGYRKEGEFLSYEEIMAQGSAQRVEVALEPDDLATISYTGGPSNHPQGAALSHRSIVTHAAVSGDGFQQSERDVVLLFALPLYHMFGLGSVLMTSVNKGSTVVIVPGTGRSIGSFFEAVEREKGTIYMGVPYIYALAISVAMRSGVKSDVRSLRLCCSAGAPITSEIIQQFKQYYGLDILDIWGLTEAVSHVTYQNMNGDKKINSSGKALSGFEIRAVDNNGEELLPDEDGEIIVRGPILTCYYNNAQATAEAKQDGWLHTGDMGRIDNDGYLFLSGRKKEIIITKGQNVYPSDIEEVLSTHPMVAETVVTGIPDKLRGEVVAAAIKLKEGAVVTEQEIRGFCKERLAAYKLPKHIVFADSLRGMGAAISKDDLRDYLAAQGKVEA